MSSSDPTGEPTSNNSSTSFKIGYAMAPKKVSSVFQDSLVKFCSTQGIDLVPVDLGKPLVEQQDQESPFHCILHKLYDEDWRHQLHQFSAKFPDVLLVDPLEHIDRLHSRATMLQVFDDKTFFSFPTSCCSQFDLGIPKQMFIDGGDDDGWSDRVSSQDLKFPVIAKPLLANGTEGSHQMYLVFNQEGLKSISLKPPLVLQEFVNHGGVVFKVYVAGNHSRCVKRRSLPDISDDKIETTKENLLPFSQISNLTDQDQSDESIEKLIEEAEMPPGEFVTELAGALRKALKLHLFNFDVIRDSSNPNRYLVIDINYFPGYAKMPSYETMLTDFFKDVVQHPPPICQ